MHKTKSEFSEAPTREIKAAPEKRSRWQFLVSRKMISALIGCGLLIAAWWYFPRSMQLATPLLAGESYPTGTAVILDDDTVGKVTGIESGATGTLVMVKLSGMNHSQIHLLKDGLVRISGTRMIWFTSEFIDRRGPPLVDGDVVPVISRAERDQKRAAARFLAWLVPGSGVGLLWLLWRGARRLWS